MNVREALSVALRGGTPDRTPLGIYDFFLHPSNRSEWEPLVDAGLGIIRHLGTVKHVEHGTERWTEDKQEGGYSYRYFHLKNPAGHVWKCSRNGWHYEDWIKSPADYDVFRWAAEHTEPVPTYDAFEQAAEELGDRGLPVVLPGRTPFMVINIDIAGTEQFCLDVAMEVPELFALYESMVKLFLETNRLVAAGPGEFVKWLENLTIGMIGPDRYAKYLLSVYEQAAPLLTAAGKRVMVHYDGQLDVISDHIARAPFHIVESLTEPPEGDLTYDEARRRWPEKAFWANINVAHYTKPEADLAAAVAALRERAGKRALAFEVSEDMPANWRTSIPVVLRTLEELG